MESMVDQRLLLQKLEAQLVECQKKLIPAKAKFQEATDRTKVLRRQLAEAEAVIVDNPMRPLLDEESDLMGRIQKLKMDSLSFDSRSRAAGSR
jgi:hypothetical protein